MDYEPHVKKYFEHLGYAVERIDEGAEETPDFFIYDDSMSFVAELKTKFPSDTEISQRRRILDSGNIHNIQEQIVRKNTLSGITRHAVEQLKKYGPQDLIRIAFLLTTGHLAEPRFHQFVATLYGSTTIVEPSKSSARECFFFYNSDFYRHRNILDGAIVSTESMHALLLNPHSPRAARLKQSTLCDRFDGGVIDPIKIESQGKAYIVDGDVDRGDEEAVIAYLKEKYHTELLTKIDMNFLSGTMNFGRAPNDA